MAFPVQTTDDEIVQVEKAIDGTMRAEDGRVFKTVAALRVEEVENVTTEEGAQTAVEAFEQILNRADKAEAPTETDAEEPTATAAAEALAEAEGVDLTEVEGSGQDGRILVSDVQALSDEAAE